MSFNKNRRSFTIENLESKEMLTSLVQFDPNTEILTINGSEGNDWYDVRNTNDGKLTVFEDVNRGQLSNGLETPNARVAFKIDQAKVAEIVFNGYRGDDYFANQTHKPSKAFGGSGNDRLEGGFGADFLHGGSGNDSLYGHFGNDRISGGGGNDFLSGSKGNDKIFGGSGNDWAFGGDGNDRIATHSQDDRAFGGDGDDKIIMGSGNDIAEGQNGNDRIVGNGGDDKLYGGEGNDKVFGGSGRNRMEGGDGNDRLVGGDDDDTILGGDGIDRVFGNGGDDFLQSGNGGLKGGKLYQSDLVIGGDGDDEIFGGSGKSILFGGDGNDQITGGTFGESWMFGDAGNDIINGGYSNDYLEGGNGNDLLYGKGGDDTFAPELGDDIVDGGTGSDSIWFSGRRWQYEVEGTFNVKMRDVRNGIFSEGNNTVRNVESVVFDKTRYSMSDLVDDDNGNPTRTKLEFDLYDNAWVSGATSNGQKLYQMTPPESGRYLVRLERSIEFYTEDLSIEVRTQTGSLIQKKTVSGLYTNIYFSANSNEKYQLNVITSSGKNISFDLKIRPTLL